MSTIDTNDSQATGEALSTESLQRLAKLRLDVALLARLAQTHWTDTLLEDTTGMRLGEMARTLTWLEARIGAFLDNPTMAAGDPERAREPHAAAEATGPDAAEPTMDEEPARYMSGITLDQIDAIHALIDSLRAHGDVVNCSNQAAFADATLAMMGDAICRDAGSLRDLMDAIEAQRLRAPQEAAPGVGEAAARYLVASIAPPARGVPITLREHPTYQ
ncbi:MAG: XAC0095 family protein [Dyella sp.]|uniref:XAC0095 family protein n=1 Tax=Dyella sp. TaxID=1869338 RepID=UPI003F7CF7ED